jgi:hypothetical protein
MGGVTRGRKREREALVIVIFGKYNLLKSAKNCLYSLLDAVQLADAPVVMQSYVFLPADSQWTCMLIDLQFIVFVGAHQSQLIIGRTFLDPFSLENVFDIVVGDDLSRLDLLSFSQAALVSLSGDYS